MTDLSVPNHISHFGYRILNIDKKPKREHILIVENHLRRRLRPEEVVHHINHDKLDNRIENLLVVTRAWHKRIHKEIGLETRFKRTLMFSDKEAYELAMQLHSQAKAAKMLGCAQPSIHRAVKRYLNNEGRQ